jgi:hypothetical protein
MTLKQYVLDTSVIKYLDFNIILYYALLLTVGRGPHFGAIKQNEVEWIWSILLLPERKHF